MNKSATLILEFTKSLPKLPLLKSNALLEYMVYNVLSCNTLIVLYYGNYRLPNGVSMHRPNPCFSHASKLSHIHCNTRMHVVKIMVYIYFVCACNLCSFYLFSEQYDAFVKFSHDQIERRLSEAPLSCEYVP